MRWLFVFFWVLCVCMGGGAMAAGSFLKPQKFPSVFNDVPFDQRMDVVAQGYKPWETEYDASGKCISGCVYRGMNIDQEMELMQQHTRRVVDELKKTGQIKPQTPQKLVEIPQKTEVGPQIASTGTQQVASGGVAEKIVQSVECSPRASNVARGQRVPLGRPIDGNAPITSPFGRRVHPITGNLQNHKGVDFGVPRGTDVFATASGTVVRVWTDDTCGNGVRISHDQQYETVFCHMDQVMVQAGDKISAGCRIGWSGNTGRSTGAHLHYAIEQGGVAINPTELIGG